VSPRILLVEDNAENRDMLSRRLLRRGFEIDFAVDGEEAVASARASRPDLILMDLSLPVIDGWEATRILKQDGTTAHIPIIALTAHAMSGDREKALQAGADDYDTKPVDLERLLAKIADLLPT
jgi:two-component system, cell cycle response regulator DivK